MITYSGIIRMNALNFPNSVSFASKQWQWNVWWSTRNSNVQRTQLNVQSAIIYIFVHRGIFALQNYPYKSFWGSLKLTHWLLNWKWSSIALNLKAFMRNSKSRQIWTSDSERLLRNLNDDFKPTTSKVAGQMVLMMLVMTYQMGEKKVKRRKYLIK